RRSTRTTSVKLQLAIPLQTPSLMRRRLYTLAGAACITTACHAGIRSTQSTPPTPEQMAELWNAPEPNRDLFWGAGGERLAPNPNATYKVLEIKRGGFSMGMTVEDGKRKCSAT